VVATERTHACDAEGCAAAGGERVLQLVFLNFLVHFGALLVLTRGTVPGEGAWLRAHEARMFSAGWMIVYLLCALAWWPLGPSYRDDGRSRPAP
jgi:hypothetical protein